MHVHRPHASASFLVLMVVAVAATILAAPAAAASGDAPSRSNRFATDSFTDRDHRAIGGLSLGIGLGYFFGIEQVDEIVGLERDEHGFVSAEDAKETTGEAMIDLHYGWRALCPFAGCAIGPYVAFNADEGGVRTHAHGLSLQFRDWSIGVGRGTRENVRYIPDDHAIAEDGTPEVRKDDFSALMALVSVRF